jgi:hypothetical protein
MKTKILRWACVVAVLTLAGCATTDIYDDITVSGNYSTYAPQVYAILPFEEAPAGTPLSEDDIEEYEDEFGPYAAVIETGAEIAQQTFEDEFVASGYDVVVRSRLTDVLREIEFQNLSGLTADDAATVGSMLNADAIVLGRVTQFNYYYVSFSVRAVDVERGVVLWSASGTRDVWDYDDDPNQAARWLARELTEQLGMLLPD